MSPRLELRRTGGGLSGTGIARSAVVYDPDPAWVESVALVLERVGIRVAASATASTRALDALAESDPDLMVIGADGAGVDAARLVRRARDSSGRASIIVLTEPGNTEQVERSLAAGAFAIIVKGPSPDDVAVAARQAFAPSIFLASSGGNGHHDLPGNGNHDVPGNGNHDVASSGLTRREVEVLRLVGEGRSNGDIARALWVTEQTVKFHLSNVYRKLGLSNRTQAARWAATRRLLD